MSIDRARVPIENGKYNRALPDLWVVQATCRRTNIDLARQLRETATDVRHQATGRTRRECDTPVDHVEANIHAMERAHEARLNDPRPRGAGGHSRL